MRHLFVIVVAVMLSLPVAAQDFEKGFEALQRGDYRFGVIPGVGSCETSHAVVNEKGFVKWRELCGIRRS